MLLNAFARGGCMSRHRGRAESPDRVMLKAWSIRDFHQTDVRRVLKT
jgi:hypothetical protein